jgi:hypothetical protein
VADFLWYHHHPALVYNVGASPIVWHWQEIWAGTRPWQIGWWMAPPLPAATLRQHIQAETQPSDVLLLLVPELHLTLLEDIASLPPVYGLPTNLPADDPVAQALFTHALKNARRVWLVTWYGQGDPQNFYEAHLRHSWGSVHDTWQDGWRVVLLAALPDELVAPADEELATFGEIELRGLSTIVDDNQLFLQLAWHLPQPVPAHFISFVHLLDNQRQIIVQQDRPLRAGYLPPSDITTITDQFAFTLPNHLEHSQLFIRLGWYQWPSLEPIGEMIEIEIGLPD